MKSILNLINAYKTIIIINDSNYVGDSVIFFWPFVNTLSDHCINSKIIVFHSHNKQFRPASESVCSFNLEAFYFMRFAPNNTLIIAFTPRSGELKKYLKQNGFQSIVKDFVGLHFITLNIPRIFFNNLELEFKFISDYEHHYSTNNKSVHIESGFPKLNWIFTNVYEYSKICLENFLCLDSIIHTHEGNIVIHDINIDVSLNELFISKLTKKEQNYILINLICGTLKTDVLEKYTSLLNWIKKISSESGKYNIFILCDDNFSKLRFDLTVSCKNIFFLKEDTGRFWNALILKANRVYSIDTGFMHIAHILNKNTFGFGGNVDFWFFKDKTIRIEDY